MSNVLPRQRFRTRGGYYSMQLISGGIKVAPAVPTGETKNPNQVLYPAGSYETMQDVSTPMFEILRSEGHIVNTAMKRTKDVYLYEERGVDFMCIASPDVRDVSNWRIYYAGPVAWWSSLKDFPFRPPFSFDRELRKLVDGDNIDQLAAIQARNKVNPVLVQSLVSLAEMHKTVDMIAGVAKTLHHLRKAIVRNASIEDIYQILGGKFKVVPSKRKTLDPILNRWLEYRYGWTPLVMEIQGALKAFDNMRNLKPRVTARGKSKGSDTVTWTRSSVPFSSVVEFGANDVYFTQRSTVESRAYVLFEADLQFQTARDFGFTEIPLAAWELVPYSFVIDWFTPIGDWLEAVTPKLGVKVIAEGVVSKRSDFISYRIGPHIPVTAPTGLCFSQSGYENTTDSYERSSVVRTPNMNVLYQFPPINVKLNVKRALDAIALVSQRI